jgi:hypothetical protein
VIERFAQVREIALGLTHWNTNVKISGGYGVGCTDKAADWRNKPVGKVKSDPDCREKHDQCDHGVHQGECDLHAEAT